MKRIITFVILLFTCLTFMSSCKNEDKKRIRIKEYITPLKLDLVQRYPIKGLNTDYILFGGQWGKKSNIGESNWWEEDYDEEYDDYSDEYPTIFQGGDYIYLDVGTTYKNEFYVLTREIKSYTYFIGYNYEYEMEIIELLPGDKVTFIWSTEDGFQGWYNSFVEDGSINPLQEGDKLQVMVIAENTTKEEIQNTDNVKGKTSAFYVNDDGSIDNMNPASEEQPLVFKSKQKVAVCEEFIYNGPGTYNVKTTIFDNEVVIDEQSLSFSNLGL